MTGANGSYLMNLIVQLIQIQITDRNPLNGTYHAPIIHSKRPCSEQLISVAVALNADAPLLAPLRPFYEVGVGLCKSKN